jgi:hypothetical protein
MLYDRCADALRNGEVVLHAFATHGQLASIDGSTLRAPEGEHDDRADAFALACAGPLCSVTAQYDLADVPGRRGQSA